MRYCIFCGDPASSKEDAWPVWLLKLLGGSANGVMETERGGQVIKSWKTEKPKLKVGFVCTNCNNGWMSQLESRVKPVVEIIFSERTVNLDSHSQSTLALWSVKTAMVLEVLRKNNSLLFFSEWERRALKEKLQMPLGISIWIAKCVNHKGIYTSASDLNGVSDTRDEVEAYVTTMGFGSLAIQVFRGKLPNIVAPSISMTADLRPGPWSEITLQIWPIQSDPVTWPASVGLSGELGLETFNKRWSPNNNKSDKTT